MSATEETWSVPRLWPGETFFLLASGPSMGEIAPGLISRIRTVGRVIAINNAWTLVPEADVLYACDDRWWREHRTEVQEGFRGEYRVALDFYAPEVKTLKPGEQFGLSVNPEILNHGCNSGYQAINLAFLLGAARIVLLGYDMKVRNGQTHFHPPHRGEVTADLFQREIETKFLPSFSSLVEPLREAGVEVLNATPGSALQCWPMVALEDVLNRCFSGIA